MALPNSPSSKELQPKVVQKMVFRTLVFVVALGALFFGIRWYRENRTDLEANETADTQGWISALEFKSEGQEVVAFKPDLSIVRSEGWKNGDADRDILWAPTGNFLYFITNRTGNVFHVYRWNPTKTEAQPRSTGTWGRSSPSFPLLPLPGSQKMMLTSGGNIVDFDPKDKSQSVVLPPVGREIATQQGDDQSAQGATGQFSARYGSLGTSFKSARYCGKDDYIAAILKGDDGETLIIEHLTDPSAKPEPWLPIAAGDHIDLDVNPVTGNPVYAVTKFQWPGNQPPAEMVKNGKVLKPFQHYLAEFDLVKKAQNVIVAVSDNRAAFTSLAINPDGKTVVVCAGPYQENAVNHLALVSFPIKQGGGAEGKTLIRGEVFEPTWDATGTHLAYAKRDTDGKRTIFTSNADGSSERNISGGKGNFGYPKFSPQQAAK